MATPVQARAHPRRHPSAPGPPDGVELTYENERTGVTEARFRREFTAGYRSAYLHIRRAGQPPPWTAPGWNLLATPHPLVATAVEGMDA
jgi:hypothetical protein